MSPPLGVPPLGVPPLGVPPLGVPPLGVPPLGVPEGVVPVGVSPVGVSVPILYCCSAGISAPVGSVYPSFISFGVGPVTSTFNPAKSAILSEDCA